MITAQEINEAALDAIDSQNGYLAQTLFRQNYKENPCFMTANNLGVFHVFEGLLKPDNRGRGADKLGIYYLNKAALIQQSPLTLRALGWVYFSEWDYAKAGSYFERACQIEIDYESAYNCAVCNYMRGDYTGASEWFEKAMTLCEPSDFTNTFCDYTFSLYYGKSDKFLAAYRKVLKFDDVDTVWEKFMFSYFAEEFQTAEGWIAPMLKHFGIGVEEMAMVVDCLIKCGKPAETEARVKHMIACYEESESIFRNDIRKLRKIVSKADDRAKLISEFKHSLRLIKQCCYHI